MVSVLVLQVGWVLRLEFTLVLAVNMKRLLARYSRFNRHAAPSSTLHILLLLSVPSGLPVRGLNFP